MSKMNNMKTEIFLTKKFINKASSLSDKRLEAFSWVKESKYGQSTKRSNNIGSFGEMGLSCILRSNGIKCKDLFTDFKGEDKGDIQVGKIYLEVKTRTAYDFKIYGNATPLKQVNRYNKQKLNVFYVWMSYDKRNKKLVLQGWNKLSDFDYKNKFLDLGKYSVKGKFIRSPKTLLRLCSTGQKNRVTLKKRK